MGLQWFPRNLKDHDNNMLSDILEVMGILSKIGIKKEETEIIEGLASNITIGISTPFSIRLLEITRVRDEAIFDVRFVTNTVTLLMFAMTDIFNIHHLNFLLNSTWLKFLLHLSSSQVNPGILNLVPPTV
ncbi:hypothetical protein NL676_020055 [Syzygium grande]|nr:hypothetical protein NL676_020055 [Syzygium grande]